MEADGKGRFAIGNGLAVNMEAKWSLTSNRCVSNVSRLNTWALGDCPIEQAPCFPQCGQW
jgi:hypothetical protein